MDQQKASQQKKQSGQENTRESANDHGKPRRSCVYEYVGPGTEVAVFRSFPVKETATIPEGFCLHGFS
jgi:hypothetical protein